MENRMIEGAAQAVYSTQAQKEKETILAKYMPKEAAPAQETPLEKMRRLDAKAESRATIVGLATGILFTLVFGAGMSAVLALDMPIPGIAAGLVGLAGMIATLPIYRRALKRERDRIAPEIVRLSEEQ